MVRVVDTPARIAILGSGPLAIETALYGRFLGYEVRVFSPQQTTAPLSVDMNDPLEVAFQDLATPLGLAAIEAQLQDYSPPAPDEEPTVQDYLERYLLPLLQTDLLRGVTVDTATLAEPAVAIAPQPEADEESELESETVLWELLLSTPQGQAAWRVGAVFDFRDLPESPASTGDASPDAPTLATEGENWFRFSPWRFPHDKHPLSDRWPGIREAFAQLVGRPNLDLYANIARHG